MSEGKKIYDEYCSACHGINGKGDGPSADELKTKPTDFGMRIDMAAAHAWMMSGRMNR